MSRSRPLLAQHHSIIPPARRAGRVRLRDDIRPEAREILSEIRARGLHPLVLTGDRQASADYLRDQLGLEDVRAELKPEAIFDIAVVDVLIKRAGKIESDIW